MREKEREREIEVDNESMVKLLISKTYDAQDNSVWFENISIF
jgi:hypothetical protein